MGLKDEADATKQTIVAGAAFTSIQKIGHGTGDLMRSNLRPRLSGDNPSIASSDQASGGGSGGSGGGSGGGLSKGLDRFKRRKANNNGDMSQIAPKPSNG